MLMDRGWLRGLTMPRNVPIAGPQILKGLNRGLWTLDNVQLCVGWKEPGLGASWFRFNVGLTGCVA